MKTEMNPIAVIGIIAVAVIALVFFGSRMLKPAPYAPSPGSPGAPGARPGAMAAPSPTADESAKHFTSAPGSTPGKPATEGH